MSRIGKMPVIIPKAVTVTISGGVITVKGPLGELKETINPLVKAEVKEGQVLLTADLKAARDASAIYGMSRARVNNMVNGVATGFTKVLDIVGLGFRAEIAGQKITMALGKSHPVLFDVPANVKVTVDAKKTQLTLTSNNKDQLGETAAKIRELRVPEPYKGTGIRYQGEHVRKKAGKTAAGASAGAAKK